MSSGSLGMVFLSQLVSRYSVFFSQSLQQLAQLYPWNPLPSYDLSRWWPLPPPHYCLVAFPGPTCGANPGDSDAQMGIPSTEIKKLGLFSFLSQI